MTATLPAKGTVLVSACLANVHCRFDAGTKANSKILDLVQAGRAVALCPEVAGGLGVPREPAEIVGGDGHDVLDGRARVITQSGRDVTTEFVTGAKAVLELARRVGASSAILKARSPSCGSGELRVKEGVRPGDGVTAALLKRNGIIVISDEEWNHTT